MLQDATATASIDCDYDQFPRTQDDDNPSFGLSLPEIGRVAITLRVRGRFTICEVSEEGLPLYVRSERKVYDTCEVSEKGLRYVRVVRKVYDM